MKLCENNIFIGDNVRKQLNKFVVDVADLLMIIAITASCFVLLNIADLYGRIYTAKHSVNPYKINMSGYYEIGSTGFESVEKPLKELVDISSNVSHGNIVVYTSTYWCLDDTFISSSVGLLFRQNEDLMIKDKNGKYIRQIKDKKENSVIVPEYIYDNFSHKDGPDRYIILNDMRMNIVAVSGNTNIDGDDDKIYLLWETASDRLKKEYTSDLFFITVDISSNKYDAAALEKELESFDSFAKKYDNLEIYDHSVNAPWKLCYSSGQTTIKMSSLFFGIAGIFSFITTFAVSDIWIRKRHKEIAVRRAFGYSISKIYILFIKDIFRAAAAALLLSVVLFLTYRAITSDLYTIQKNFFVKIPVVIAGLIIILFINSTAAIIKAKKIMPAAVLNSTNM